MFLWNVIPHARHNVSGHYNDVIMRAMASQITNLTIVHSTVYAGADKKPKLRVSGLCAGIHRWPVNSPHKLPVTREMFPFDDVFVRFTQTAIEAGTGINNYIPYFMWKWLYIHAIIPG